MKRLLFNVDEEEGTGQWRHTFSKVFSSMTLRSKQSRTLTFEFFSCVKASQDTGLRNPNRTLTLEIFFCVKKKRLLKTLGYGIRTRDVGVYTIVQPDQYPLIMGPSPLWDAMQYGLFGIRPTPAQHRATEFHTSTQARSKKKNTGAPKKNKPKVN